MDVMDQKRQLSFDLKFIVPVLVLVLVLESIECVFRDGLNGLNGH